MMGRALLVLGWISTAGIAYTGLLGFKTSVDGGLGTHLLVGLASSLLLLFSHCWIMFYLIGTGKAVKTAVAEHDLDSEFIEITKELKNRSYPSLMLAMIVVMVTFIVGGGVATRVIPNWIHSGLFFLSLGVQIRALLVEGAVLADNERLLSEVGSRSS